MIKNLVLVTNDMNEQFHIEQELFQEIFPDAADDVTDRPVNQLDTDKIHNLSKNDNKFLVANRQKFGSKYAQLVETFNSWYVQFQGDDDKLVHLHAVVFNREPDLPAFLKRVMYWQ